MIISDGGRARDFSTKKAPPYSNPLPARSVNVFEQQGFSSQIQQAHDYPSQRQQVP
jgi:hypothetical protein